MVVRRGLHMKRRAVRAPRPSGSTALGARPKAMAQCSAPQKQQRRQRLQQQQQQMVAQDELSRDKATEKRSASSSGGAAVSACPTMLENVTRLEAELTSARLALEVMRRRLQASLGDLDMATGRADDAVKRSCHSAAQLLYARNLLWGLSFNVQVPLAERMQIQTLLLGMAQMDGAALAVHPQGPTPGSGREIRPTS